MLTLMPLLAMIALVTASLGAQAPTAPLPDSQGEGRRIFQQKCAVCHMQLSSGPNTPLYAPKLSRGSIERNDTRARELILNGSERMPGWKLALKPAQIDKVIEYLKTLDAPPVTLPVMLTTGLSGNGPNTLLTGVVKAASGKAMEGVTISARPAGKPLTVSVYTDARGTYQFPPLEQGAYQVWAQAIGWEKSERRIALGGDAQRENFALASTPDYSAQLPGDLLVAALPADTAAHRRMKMVFVGLCTECHSANMILSSNRFDEKGWSAIITAMAHIGSLNTLSPPQSPGSPAMAYFQKDLAAYLAEMRGPGSSPMRFTVPPRPTGDAALPVVYEYDLPFEVGGGYGLNGGSDWSRGNPASSGGGFGVHDATSDFAGNIWFTYNDLQSEARSFGRIDGRTLKATDFRYPRPEPDRRVSNTHGIQTAKNGMIWFNVNQRQNGKAGSEKLGRVDPRTNAFEVFTPPGDLRGITIHLDEDSQGNLWGDTETGAMRFSPKTGEFTPFTSVSPGSTYGAAADRDGNGWWTQMLQDRVVHGDVTTGKVTEIRLPIPPVPYLEEGDLSPEDIKMYLARGRTTWQAPRRPSADDASPDVWIPNFSGNNLMRIDIDTRKVSYYPAPRPGMNPYKAGVDTSHQVWVSMQGADDVGRFDPATLKWTLYSWPSRGTALRGISVVDHDGVVEVVGAYFNGARVGRMVMRKAADVQALTQQAQRTLQGAR